MPSLKSILIYLIIGCIINLFLASQRAITHWRIAAYFLFLWPAVLGRGLAKMVIEKWGRKR